MALTLTRGLLGSSTSLSAVGMAPNLFPLSDDPSAGGVFLGVNPTPGTGIAGIAAPTAFADTSPFLLLTNTGSGDIQTGMRVHVLGLMLRCTAAGTGGTDTFLTVKLDDYNPLRYTSGAGADVIPVNVNMASGQKSVSRIRAGALVCTATASEARLLKTLLITDVIPAVNEQFEFTFGGAEQHAKTSYDGTTTGQKHEFSMPPISIGPGQHAAFHLWRASQSGAASWEFAMLLAEKLPSG